MVEALKAEQDLASAGDETYRTTSHWQLQSQHQPGNLDCHRLLQPRFLRTTAVAISSPLLSSPLLSSPLLSSSPPLRSSPAPLLMTSRVFKCIFVLLLVTQATATTPYPPPYRTGLYSPPPAGDDLVPCTYDKGVPRSIYYPYNVDTEEPFMQILYKSLCSVFDSVPKAAYDQLYLNEGITINFYGAYNNVTQIQYGVPQPGNDGSVSWDFTVSPAKVTVYVNGSVIYTSSAPARRRLTSDHVTRTLLQEGLPPGACMTDKYCQYMATSVTLETAVACLISIRLVPRAALGVGLICAVVGAGASAYCTRLECDRPCSELVCHQSGYVGRCAGLFCDYCVCVPNNT